MNGARLSPVASVKRDKLVFSKVTPSDRGVYLCKAVGSSGTSTLAKVTVELKENPKRTIAKDQSISRCTNQPDYGTCGFKNFVVRWYFDKAAGICKPFVYSGCGGNTNRFVTKRKCEAFCQGDVEQSKKCPVSASSEVCSAPGVDQCLEDQDCQMGLKCCKVGCERKCVVPVVPTKPGKCPLPLPRGLASCADEVGHECDVDSDCEDDMKCCVWAMGCERSCVKPPKLEQKCNSTLDLGFIIDASGSIRNHQWPHIIDFVKSTVDGFEILESVTHVGAISYSTTPVLEFRFNTLKGGKLTSANVKTLLNRVRHQRGYTFADKALTLANQQLFTKKAGMRIAVKKVLLVLMHGRQTTHKGPATPLNMAAQGLKDKGVEIWALGVGDEVSRAELIDVASDLDKVITVGSFGAMKGIVDEVVIGACKVSNLKVCQKAYREAIKSSSPFIPRCNTDGTYNSVQCQGEICYCVDQNGGRIAGSDTRREAGLPACSSVGLLTPCQQAYNQAIIRPSIGQYIPRCKADGNYEEVQCEGVTGECWCVDSRGQERPGTRTKDSLLCPPLSSQIHSHSDHKDMLTDCQRRYVQLSRSPIPGRYLPWCTPDGRYNWLQCYEFYCFCVNVDGYEIAGTRLFSEAGTPNCTAQGVSLTPCQKQKQALGSRRLIPDRYTPTCKPDGRFEEVQCNPATSACWCVDSDGQEIMGSRSTGPVKCTKQGEPLTKCQEQFQAALRSRSAASVAPWCVSDGSYEPIQCYGPECYCVDQEGAIIEGTMVSLVQGRPDCSKSANQRSKCQISGQDFALSLTKGNTPKCKQDGAYEEIQCNAIARQCWCVDRSGKEIPDTQTSGTIRCPTIGASLAPCHEEYQEKTRNWLLEARSVPWCLQDGLYEPRQCHRSDCYCVTSLGVELAESRVKIARGEAWCDQKGGDTICQRKAKETNSPVAESAAPECDQDGRFTEVQCQGVTCSCVNAHGIEVKSTRHARADGKPNCPSQGSVLSNCQKAVETALISNSAFVPRCARDGSYNPVQCGSGECWCVDDNGQEVDGSRSTTNVMCQNAAALSSPCWQEYQAKARSSSFSYVPRCNSDGSYDDVQCFSGYCFCVDKKGAQKRGYGVNVMRNGPIKCDKKDEHKTDCQRRRAEILNGMTSYKFIPECTADGGYSRVQCESRSSGPCWCADDTGREINGTRTTGTVTCPGSKETTCGGVFFSWFGPANGLWNHVPVCLVGGRYRKVQCDGNSGYCWCVDKNGSPIMRTATRGIPVCPSQDGSSPRTDPVTRCQEHRERVLGPKGVADPGSYVPVCRDDGSYEDVQCNKTYSSLVCWCVDESGMEIKGTKRTGKINDCIPRVPETECQSQVKQALETPSGKGRFVPRCKADGQFEEVQCNEWTGQCWCVDNSGIEIQGTRTKDFVSCPGQKRGMTDCQRQYREAEEDKFTMGRFMSRCTPEGRYHDVQCQESVCYCVNANGDEIYGTRVDMPSRPNCTNAANSLTVCQYKHQVSSVNAAPGAFVPQCRSDGGYDVVQCRGAVCYCVDKRGIEIQGTRLPIADKRPNCDNPALELTLCQRQYQEYWKNPVSGRYVPRCDSKGSFEKTQCLGGYCFCVDDDGTERKGSQVLQTDGLIDCSDQDRPLTPCQTELARVLSSPPNPNRGAPRCAADGAYHVVQCDDTQTGECWCVNGSNSEIPGTRRKGRVNCTQAKGRQTESACVLGQAQNTISFAKFIPKCARNGFDSFQCDYQYGYCWCSDVNGNMVPLTTSRGRAVCNSSAPLPRCKIQQMRARGLTGVAPPSAYIPQCLDDGSYESVQCLQATQYCWCVGSNGFEIPGSREFGRPDCDDMKGLLKSANGNHKREKSACHHARQRALGPSNMPSAASFVPDCEADGTFKAVQCHRATGYCWCVDKAGQEQPGSRTQQAPNCSSAAINLTTCHTDRMRALAWTGRLIINTFVPRCLPDGSFEAIQCQPATGKCWCVDVNGNELVGTRTDSKPVCTSRDGETLCQKKLKSSSYTTTCEQDGSFSAVQCRPGNGVERQCWCVDRQGNEIPKTRTTGTPACDFAAGLSECQRERQRVLGWSGVAVDGTFVPECTADGGYERVQCHEVTGFCWCVDGNGNEIPKSRLQGRPVCNHKVPLSPCLKERQRGQGWSGHHNGVFIPQCAENGTYDEVQCYEGACWCSDPHGYELPGTRSTQGTPDCSLVPANFTACRRWRLRVLGADGGPVPVDVFVPVCEANGLFKKVQCSDTYGYCWCVDMNGNMISGTKTLGSAPSCENRAGPTKCQQEQSVASGSFVPACQADGSYASEQCDTAKGECWCVDEQGGEEENTRVLGTSAFCQPSAGLTICQKELRRAQGFVGKAPKGRFVPKCKADGSYDNVQCHITGYCWCVDLEGTEVLGTRTSGKPLCYAAAGLSKCQVDRQLALGGSNSGLKGKLPPKCRPDGSYEEVQCDRKLGECWCVDQNGKEVPRTRQLGVPLYCSGEESSHCVRERERALAWTGISVPGLFVPECKPDGTYEGMQCHVGTGLCWCVDRWGHEIIGTRVKGSPDCRSAQASISNCVLDQQKALLWSRQYDSIYGVFSPSCEDDGNYTNIQCHSQTGYCWCVNQDGNELWGSRTRGQQPDCKAFEDTVTQCSKEQKEGMKYRQADNLLSRFVPECDQRGGYSPVQCDGAGFCWCVDKYGLELPRTKVKGLPRTCGIYAGTTACQRERYLSLSLNGSPPPGRFEASCAEDGSYNSVQCGSGLCWCVDKEGLEIPRTQSKVKPQCELNENKLTECQQERYRTLARAGQFTPECDNDGTYKTRQCFNGLCWCVDRYGNEIQGTRSSEQGTCPDVLPEDSLTACQAKRQESLNSGEVSNGFVPLCKENGMFRPVQCLAGSTYCWCVDKYGQELPRTRTEGTPYCGPLAGLTMCQKERQIAIGWTGVAAPGSFVPKCKSNGEYDTVQCHGSTGFCWCVDDDGNEISATRTRGRPVCVVFNGLTKCQQERERALGVLGTQPPGRYVPKCTPEGAYVTEQCHTSTGFCWCVDNMGRELPDTRRKGNALCDGRGQLSPCNADYMWTMALSIKDGYYPACLRDGNYREIQCHYAPGKQCWCVDENGNPISGTMAKSPNCTTSDEGIRLTTCQERRRKSLDSSGSTPRKRTSFIPQCKQDGSFDSIQCHALSAECWCVDRRGTEIPGTRTKGRPNCEKPACMQERMYAMGDRAIPGRYVPKCTVDGRYSPMQCHYSSGYCWCVDEFGREVPNTRIQGKPICGIKGGSMSSCQRMRREGLRNLAPGRPVARCKADGSFDQVQCQGTVCYCVNKNGEEIPGTRIDLPDKPQCLAVQKNEGVPSSKCLAQYRNAMMNFAINRFVPHCKSDGQFEAVQCTDGWYWCWCVDKVGQEIKGTRTRGWPKCAGVDDYPSNPLTRCQSEYRSALKSYIYGRYVPRCRPDGSYELVQCHSSLCFCVNQYGVEIAGTRRPGLNPPKCNVFPDGKTKCQQQYESRRTLYPLGAFVPRCKPDGAYTNVQCDQGRFCWCVDRDGQEVPGTRTPGWPKCPEQDQSSSPCHLEFKEANTKDACAPLCKPDGGYELVQCQAGDCFCVDDKGREIPDTATSLPNTPTCIAAGRTMSPCERQYELAIQRHVLSRWIPRCRSDGTYEPVQCDRGWYCWCSDVDGKELPGTRKRGWPDCGIKIAKLTRCQRLHMLSLQHLIPGRFIPRCRGDGSFDPVQCFGSVCLCVDRYGVGVAGTSKSRFMEPDCAPLGSTLTDCQRHYQQAVRLRSAGHFVPTCRVDGSYQPLQCYGSVCFCVDDNGVEVLGSRSRLPETPNCDKNAEQKMSNCKKYYKDVIMSLDPTAFVPRCMGDGTYHPVQCRGMACYCVDANGREIEKTSSPRPLSPDCFGAVPKQCHQEYASAITTFRPGRYLPRCTTSGLYQDVQMKDYYTYCVDAKGQEIDGTRRPVPFNPQCKYLDKTGFALRPGFCQIPWENGTSCGMAKDECAYDPECPDAAKCCFSGCRNTCVQREKDDICSRVINLAIAVDTSMNMDRCTWTRNLGFLRALALKFAVSPDTVRIALVSFAENANVENSFHDPNRPFIDIQEIRRIMSKIGWTGGKSDVNKALDVADTMLFDSKGEVRIQSSKVLVVLTDDSRAFALSSKMKSLKSKGVSVYGIRVDKKQQATITPDAVFAKSSMTLMKAVDPLANTICSANDCKAEFDVAFLVDASDSIGRSSWKLSKQFLLEFLKTFEIGEDRVQLAVITYSTDAKIAFRFNTLKGNDLNAEKVGALIDSMKWKKGYTFIDKALQLAHDEIFTPVAGMRMDVPKVLIVLTDGKQSKNKGPFREPAIVAKSLKQKDVSIYTVGITSSVDKSELESIASSPNMTFYTESFASLRTITEQLQNSVCKRAQEKNSTCPSKWKAINGSVCDVTRDLCSSNNECLGQLICCNSGCNQECVKPQVFAMAPYSDCEADKSSGVITCKCPDCKDKSDPVCGSDNVTYASECQLRRAACLNDTWITTQRKGDCDVCKDVSCTSPPFSTCVALNGRPACSCPSSCGDESLPQPICGSNNKTYANECELRMDSCKNNKSIAIQFRKECPAPCQGKVDLAFIVDSSGTIGPMNWKLIKGFIISLAKEFDIGEDGARIAVISYSTDAKVELRFRDLVGQDINHKNVSAVIQPMPRQKGYTFIDKALYLADNEVFTIEAGMRLNAAKVAMVFTDGKQTRKRGNFTELFIASRGLKAKGVILYAMGIGYTWDQAELEEIASDPDKVVSASSFEVLHEIAEKLKESLCRVASLSKDGQCPDNWKGINGSTCDGEKNSCNSDGDCLDDLKCCHSGCHKQCVKPNQVVDLSPYATCEANVPSGKISCTCPECSKREDPVCGSDSKTYPNECRMRQEACWNNKWIIVAQQEECDPCNKYNCITPPYSSCTTKDNKPTCICPECPQVDKPVCGTNNKTYTSECALQVDACKTNTSIDVQLDKPCPEPCNPAIDMALLVDSSDSIGADGWIKMKNYLTSMLREFDISENRTRLGIIVYSSDAKVIMKFNTLKGKDLSLQGVSSLIKQIEWQRGLTFIDKALMLADKELFTAAAGMRADSKKVLVLLTDGRQSSDKGSYTDLSVASGGVKKKGVTLFAIGFEDQFVTSELEQIASDPKNVMASKSFGDYKKVAEMIKTAVCQDPKPTKTDGQCPKMWKGVNGTVCGDRADSCQKDRDCPNNFMCCDSGCYKQCVKPNQVFTMPPFSICEVPMRSGQIYCVCPECDNTESPVCTNDGKKFPNECQMRQDACFNKQWTTPISCDPCSNFTCDSPPYSTCKAQDDQPTCVCVEPCPKTLKPVYGTDNKNYDNECLLKLAACKSNTRILIAGFGRYNPCKDVNCTSPPYSSCRPLDNKPVCACPENCSSTVDPVCGTDNNTYDNECLMRQQACVANATVAVRRKGHCDPCYNVTCDSPPYSTCKAQDDQPTCVCVEPCPKTLKPVYGTDNKNYDNECLLKLAACKSNTRILIAGFGRYNPCKDVNCTSPPYSSCRPLDNKPVCACPENCSSTVDPVCGTDNNTYDNECLMRQQACVANATVAVRRKGHCDPCSNVTCDSPPYSTCKAQDDQPTCVCVEPCPKTLKPVYGTDNKNYDNECLLKLAACKSNTRILIAGFGRYNPCKDVNCTSPPYSSCRPLDNKPVCACPENCSSTVDPVCGSDNNTYDNECLMRQQACVANTTVAVRRKGDCDPCSNVTCDSPPYSTCKAQDDQPTCVCVEPCPKTLKPVYGTDNKNYDNECLLKLAACKSNTRILIAGFGRYNPCKDVNCTSPPYSSCRPLDNKPVCACPENCSSTVDPVCGTDNNTYDNECLMRQQACVANATVAVRRKGHCDPCSNVTCDSPPYSTCKAQDDQPTCVCVEQCPKTLKPVYGTDNKNYDNECLLKLAACKSNTRILIAGFGRYNPCKDVNCTSPPYSSCRPLDNKPVCACPENCSSTVDPVCGSDNNTYDNECLMRQQACVANTTVAVRRKGDCDPCFNVTCDSPPYSTCKAQDDQPTCVCVEPCPKTLKPVYGTDNKNYDNECLLKLAACKSNTRILIAGFGRYNPCKDVNCTSPPYSSCRPLDNKPVCACPENCSSTVDPVCGSDNNTYDNECLMRQQACVANTTVAVRRKGDCDPCFNVTCDSPPYSTCKAQDDQPTCVCVEPCPKTLKPVYGTDNKNYDNECLLKLAACKSNTRILIAGFGRYNPCKDVNCTSPPYSSCRPLDNKPVCACPENCSSTVDPVCGTDNNTYDNECLMRQQACVANATVAVRRKGHCDPCSNVTCDSPPYSTCKAQDDQPTCVCVEPCPKTLKPVYGTDNKNYDNECLLKLAACKSNTRILIAGFGRYNPCKDVNCTSSPYSSCRPLDNKPVCACPENCSSTVDPVCGTDNNTYDNECLMRQQACVANTTVAVRRKGHCDPCSNVTCDSPPYSTCKAQDDQPTCVCVEPCLKTLKPVYGTDNKNYDNECLLKLAACKSNTRILIAGFGRYNPCKDVNCTSPPYSSCRPLDNKPVCACPENCSSTVDPVCGTDNNTYDNECFMRQQACVANTTVAVRRKGDCDPCSNVTCDSPPYSTCKAQDDQPTCVCVEPCPKTLKPVYGTDNKNYDNECLLKLAACKSNTRILIAGFGRYNPCEGFNCSSPPYSSCQAKDGKATCECSEDCPKTLKPVCGSDNNDYDNECLMQARACATNKTITAHRNGYCDPCKNHSCSTPPYSTCKAVDDKAECVCSKVCPRSLDLVCGTDNITYNNECFLKRQGCETNRTITVRRKGHCDPCKLYECSSPPYSICQAVADKPMCVCPKDCPASLDLVCGTDNITYSNECLMKYQACRTNSALKVKRKGDCDVCKDFDCSSAPYSSCEAVNDKPICVCPKICPITLDPVCASDNNTYPNECAMKQLACQSAKVLTFRRKGDCDPCNDFDCTAPYSTCEAKDDKAVCVCPKCPKIVKQVCGSDGKTYDNECVLRMAACESNRTLTVRNEGNCGLCEGFSCDSVPYSRCTIINGSPTCVCPPSCPNTLDPVCGSDLQSYDNVCFLRMQSCQQISLITVLRPNYCDPCQNFICSAPYSSCEVKDNEAVCECPKDCPKEDAEVCGTNWKTYTNECMMRKQACMNNSMVTVRSIGRCDPCVRYDCGSTNPYSTCKPKGDSGVECICPTCPKAKDYLCASNNLTYMSKCHLERASCQLGRYLTIKQKGKCVCRAKVDLGFLVDSSGSIGRRNWGRTKAFIKHIIDEFEIGPDRSRVAAIYYSTEPKITFGFDYFKGNDITKNNYNQLIDKMEWLRGYTFIDKALKLANEELFTKERGMREDVKNVLLVMTDGKQSTFTSFTPLNIASRPLKQKGVRVYALGIGSAVNRRELNQIATHYKRDVFMATSFKTLDEKIKDIIESVCFPDPCDTFLCTRPFSKCNVVDSIPVCSCPDDCTNETKPICASDGQTYDNECLMQKRACENNQNLNVTSDRACPCKDPVDLAFVVDSSGSIGRKNFNSMMQFIVDVIRNFNPGPNGTHVSMVSYSTDARVDFKFNSLRPSNITTSTYAALLRSVDRLDGFTFIDKALALANKELFTEEAGMRKNVHKIMLLLTDGYQTKDMGPYTPLDRAVRPIKKKGFRVYSLGIGSEVNLGELRLLASNPLQDVFVANTFDELKLKVNEISYQFCYKVGDPCLSFDCNRLYGECKVVGDMPQCVCPPACKPTLTPVCGSDGVTYESECGMIQKACQTNTSITLVANEACKCDVVLDLAFIIDSSGSIGRSNWELIRNFTRLIIANFKVQEGNTHVAAVTYSSGAKVEFTFDTLRGPERTLEKYGEIIQKMRWQRGYTYIDKGLLLANRDIFTEKAGMRPGVPKAAIVLTDGYQTTDRGPFIPMAEASRPLKDKGVHIYAIGIGTRLNRDELRDISSHPEKDVFVASSFADLQNYVQDIARGICNKRSGIDVMDWHAKRTPGHQNRNKKAS
ncbi:uncharacterized protein LOC5512067 isoform X7 [Nematostella vectensis]|nr:uncharacterized protein LOC5512067 isoform X7 [Nematostella vectensis]